MKLIESPAFWIATVAFCIAAVVVLLRFRRKRSWGFKDAIQNPGYWAHADQILENAEKATEDAKQWDDTSVSHAVVAYLFKAKSSREAWVEKRQLEGLGSRTHRQVLELLADTSRYSQWVTPTGTNLLPEAPFHRACHLLGDTPPLVAIPLLAPFLNDKDKSIRKEAAMALGKTGSLAMVSLLRRALTDPDDYVRSYALGGLQWARTTRSLSADTAVALFDDVRVLVEKEQNTDTSADVLFILDPKRAEEIFLSPAIFRPDSRILHEALKVMTEAKVSIPRERLRELIESLRNGDVEYPKEYMLSQALQLLGHHRHPEDLPLLEALQQHQDEDVASGSSQGMLAWHGADGFEERLSKREEEHGYASLTRPQQHYSSVFVLDAEIKNGGLDQYFLNSSGDHWRDAQEGLKAMNATKHLEVLEEAVAKFGPGGPSTEQRTRQKQLAAIARKNKDAFEALDSRYYDIDQPFEVLASRYVLANPEAFR